MLDFIMEFIIFIFIMKIKIVFTVVLLAIFINSVTAQSNINQTMLSNSLMETNYTTQSNINQIKLSNNSMQTNYTQKNSKILYFDYIWKSAACPGLGQFFLGRKTKAVIFYTSFVTSVALGVYFHSKAENTYQDYIEAKDTKDVTRLYDDYIMENQSANTFFYISAGIWIYNIVDVVLDVRWLNNLENKGGNIYGTVYKKKF